MRSAAAAELPPPALPDGPGPGRGGPCCRSYGSLSVIGSTTVTAGGAVGFEAKDAVSLTAVPDIWAPARRLSIDPLTLGLRDPRES